MERSALLSHPPSESELDDSEHLSASNSSTSLSSVSLDLIEAREPESSSTVANDQEHSTQPEERPGVEGWVFT